nr:hypothetical protein [uncultured Rhodopila sp.]
MSLYLQDLVARARPGQPAIRPPRTPRWLPPEAAAAEPSAPVATRPAPPGEPPAAVAPVAMPREPLFPRGPEPAHALPPAAALREAPVVPEPLVADARPPNPRQTETRQSAMPAPVHEAAPIVVPVHEPAPMSAAAAVPHPASAPAPEAAPTVATVIARLVETAIRPAAPQPEAARARQPDTQAAESEAATYIHIGRVELHAAPPAVTVQRASPKPAHQHMSLDEYLRRRNGRPQ